MTHVVLLGDSIFDNAAYVPGQLPVISQLQKCLPNSWQATLLAIDGDVTGSVRDQTAHLPMDSTHLVVSCGGNDALGQIGLLKEAVPTIFAALNQLADIRDAFQTEYRGMLEHTRTFGKSLVVCTIYDAIPGLDRAHKLALCIFNDIIIREAARVGVPVIDLRLVCGEASDYSEISPIEPSAKGGKKIASVIAALLVSNEKISDQSAIYGCPITRT